MRANKKTLMAIKNFLQNEEGWDLDKVINDITSETNLLHHETMGTHTLSADECSVSWGEDMICDLEEFIENYTDVFIKKICNVLDSFVGEDIDDYLYDED